MILDPRPGHLEGIAGRRCTGAAWRPRRVRTAGVTDADGQVAARSTVAGRAAPAGPRHRGSRPTSSPRSTIVFAVADRPAPSRAAAAEPVRLLHLPRELNVPTVARAQPVRQGRDPPRARRPRTPTAHELTDLNVSVALARRPGRQPTSPATTPRSCRPTRRRTPSTRSPASTASASIEEFALRLARHFVDVQPSIHRRAGRRSRSTPGSRSRPALLRAATAARSAPRAVAPRPTARHPGRVRRDGTWCCSTRPTRSSTASSRTSTPRCRRPPTGSWPPRVTPPGGTPPTPDRGRTRLRGGARGA